MVEILKYLASGLIIFSFLLYFVLILTNRRKIITKSDGFNLTKDILNQYDSINIIENKGYFTVYNIKRRVIKIASRSYYGNSLSDIAIPLVEAGISAIDNYKNRIINFFRNIIPNLKVLYLLPILAIIINNVTYNVSDARVSIVIIFIFAVANYLLIDIKNEAFNWISDNLEKIKDISKDDKQIILNYLNKLLFFDRLIFIGVLVMIIRCVAIILEMN